jgi:transposase
MTKQSRSFSAEFKREAADLVLKQNYSYIEASRSLGVGESALRRWVDQGTRLAKSPTRSL